LLERYAEAFELFQFVADFEFETSARNDINHGDILGKPHPFLGLGMVVKRLPQAQLVFGSDDPASCEVQACLKGRGGSSTACLDVCLGRNQVQSSTLCSRQRGLVTESRVHTNRCAAR